jgi:outer membrane autotransporter protein
MNAAYATDVTITAATDDIDAAMLSTAAANDIILDPAGDGVIATLAIAVPTVTDFTLSGNTADTVILKIANTAAITVAPAFDVTTGDHGTLAVEFATADTAPSIVSYTGAVASTGTSAITVGSSTTAGSISFLNAGALVVDTVTITGGDHADEDSTLYAQNAVTATAISLDDNTGVANLVLGTDASVTIAGTINAAADGEGTVQITGATKTFSGIIGGTYDIGTLDIDNTAIFSANVSSVAIDIAADKTATFKDDITATAITLTNATSKLVAEVAGSAADTTIAGTIDGAADNLGVLQVTNDSQTTTFTGAIGSTYDLLTVDIDEAAVFNSSVSTKAMDVASAKAVTFKGDVTLGSTGAILNGVAGEVILDAAGDQTVTGTFVGGSAEEGVIDNANTDGTVTFASALGGTELKEVELDASSISVFNSTVKSALIDIAGKATFKENSNVANNLTLASGGTIIIDDTVVTTEEVFTVGTGFVDGSIAGTGNIKMPANLLDGEYLILIAQTTDAADAAIVVDVEAAVFDTALRTYTASAVANSTNDNDIKVTAADRAASDVASNLGTTTNMGSALIKAAIAVENDSTALDAFSNALNAEGGYSATEDTALAKQVAPQDDMISGSTFSTKAMTGSLQGIMSNRMASLRSGDAFVTGMSAGNGMSVNSGFIQAFGTEAEQKNKTVGSGTQFGYDASSSGLALGFDGITDNGSVVGLSFSMSNTDVDGKGTGNSKNDIDSYTVSVYADKTTDAGYIEGSLTAGLNENNSSRIVNTAGLNRTYKGDYDSEQVSLKIGGGMPNAVGTGFVTPYGSVTATRITTDAYTETSTTASDNLRLRVAQDDVDSIVGTVGLKYHTVLDNGGSPMISLAINNEFGDNTINSTNTYQGGGTAFNTSTDVEELSATLGLGYSFRSDNTTLELAYEADANDDDYLGHYGSIKIVSKF